MSRALTLLVLAATVLASASDVAARSQAPAPHDPSPLAEPPEPKSPDAIELARATDRVIVGWRRPEQAGRVAAERGLRIASQNVPVALPAVSVLETGGRPVEAVVAELAADPSVAYAEPDHLLSISAVSVNDPKTADQYSLNRMRVRDAWSIRKGGDRIVAVLDTGVWTEHPDLGGRLVAGHDFVNDDKNAADDNGHGTWVAGIIAANPNNGVGVAGVSWTDKVMPVKVMDSSGSGYTSDVAFGIHWAVDHGASIINMSIGGTGMTSSFLASAIDYAWSENVVLVGAAGNFAREGAFYPASYPKVVSVSATQVDDEFSNWSNYGADVDVSAPGASVLTTNCAGCLPDYTDVSGDNRYTYISGTSFATPNVAGVVALIWARYPSYTNAQVVARLKATVDDLGYAGWDARYGHGRVNALRALGGDPARISVSGMDGLEGNNQLSSARAISIGTTVKPTIYPAGDVDVFSIAAPRAGRINIAVTPIVDLRAWPWNKSTLAVDPVLSLYRSDGSFIKEVDAADAGATDRASVQMAAAGRVYLRVHNYTPNGNRLPYSVSTAFVDNVAPVATVTTPPAGATGISQFADPRATFNEAVRNVSSSTLRLRDTVSGSLVPATVSYDAASRTARLSPSIRLQAVRTYRVELTTGITDLAGNAPAATASRFTTALSRFGDVDGTPFAREIEWMADAGITTGCTEERFCPRAPVTREQMASFLARALKLPPTSRDYFTDDEASRHEDNINRIAAAGITRGCASARYCPLGTVTREQMASFLARALKLPAASRDYFTDDERSAHEADINRVAAAAITKGCGDRLYCPRMVVTREQMAAFLYRAFADR